MKKIMEFAIKFYSLEFNNNFININELFTSLLLLGSELINADKFLDLIKEYIPENKREETNIFLTKEEFMNLPLWFDDDEYLNALKDSNEKDKYNDIIGEKNLEQEENKENSQEKKSLKINAIKEAIFDINSENNILELNKILLLLNKLNDINLSKDNINNYEESNKTNLNLRKNKDVVNNDNPNQIMEVSKDESNKMDTSKLNIDSKVSSSLQSANKNKVDDSKIKENINNIYNILFN